MDEEPKGDCPFCDAPKWHICDHFTGYVRDGQVVQDDGPARSERSNLKNLRPMRAGEVAVDTGASVRAYRRKS